MRPLVDPARLAEGLRATCRRFLADERGASLPLAAAAVIPLMGFIGLGTDAARGYLVKARLGDSLDAAVLAAAHETDDNSKLHERDPEVFQRQLPARLHGRGR